MGFYDKSYDRVNTKNEKPLRGINRIFHKVTTSDDPVIPEVPGFHVINNNNNYYYLTA